VSVAWFGCAWSHQATAQTDSVPGQPVYDPPVPVTQVPSGEIRPDPVTGAARYAPKNVAETMKENFGRGPNEQIARGYYAEADVLYRARNYHDAAKKYEAAADRLPDSSLEESALFMAGEAHFFADEYSKAEDTYEMIVKKYTNSRWLNIIVTRQYAIGVYWLQYDRANPHWMLTPNFTDSKRPSFDTFGYAIRCFDNVRINDPRGKFADEAVWTTANAYFIKGHWDDADYYYKLIRTDYPKSPHQKDAHLLAIQVKFRRYQGPTYDDRPLKDAETLIDQTIAQFGSELGDERQRLLTAKAEVHREMALRSWTLAQFYEKGQYYRAARIYYADLIKQYPQTELAQSARERMTAIKDLPGYPEDHFYLLAEFFDGKDPNKERAEREGPTPTVQPMVAAQPDSNAPVQR
jgi:outer membrane protein assembly factor BamD (BamD/ComL family)